MLTHKDREVSKILLCKNVGPFIRPQTEVVIKSVLNYPTVTILTTLFTAGLVEIEKKNY